MIAARYIAQITALAMELATTPLEHVCVTQNTWILTILLAPPFIYFAKMTHAVGMGSVAMRKVYAIVTLDSMEIYANTNIVQPNVLCTEPAIILREYVYAIHIGMDLRAWSPHILVLITAVAMVRVTKPLAIVFVKISTLEKAVN